VLAHRLVGGAAHQLRRTREQRQELAHPRESRYRLPASVPRD
jgi:hypothetical protein